MAQPIVSYYTADASTLVSTWDIGEIDANTTSPTLNLTVWNNKGGTTDVSHMKNVTITCVDGQGGDTDAMIAGQWMQVSVNKATAVAVGGTTSTPMRAVGLDAAVGNLIYGTANDGTIANAKNNYSFLDCAVKVPSNAQEGEHDFKIRSQYFFV